MMIDVTLTYLKDRIFEGLPASEAATFPESFRQAIPAGADLRGVRHQFLHWLLTSSDPSLDLSAHADDAGRACLSAVAALHLRAARGEAVPAEEWAGARATARAAVESAETARATAWERASARARARASAAVWAARAAASAAEGEASWSAAAAASASAWAEAEAETEAEGEAWSRMASELLRLLKLAPGPR